MFKNPFKREEKKEQLRRPTMSGFPFNLSKAGRKPIFREEDREEVWATLLETRNISETARRFECNRNTIKKFMRKYPYKPKVP